MYKYRCALWRGQTFFFGHFTRVTIIVPLRADSSLIVIYKPNELNFPCYVSNPFPVSWEFNAEPLLMSKDGPLSSFQPNTRKCVSQHFSHVSKTQCLAFHAQFCDRLECTIWGLMVHFAKTALTMWTHSCTQTVSVHDLEHCHCVVWKSCHAILMLTKLQPFTLSFFHFLVHHSSLDSFSCFCYDPAQWVSFSIVAESSWNELAELAPWN